MPRDGNGNYVPPTSSWNPPVLGNIAGNTDWAALLADETAAMTQSLSRDGQSPMTGNLPMGNNKIINLAAGVANTDAANVGQLVNYQPAVYLAQCRLTKSGSNLLLSRFNGSYLTINGTPQLIPVAGVTLAPGSVTPSTLYYIYAYMVTTVMTLEASTTGHSTDANTGIEIKTGDATRTLVGMARPIAGPLWIDNENQRFVISWFNRRPIHTAAAFTAARTTASASYVEINTEIRNEFLCWGTDAVSMSFDGSVVNTALNGLVNTTISQDGAVAWLNAWSRFQAYANGATGPVACTATTSMSEGYHFTTIVGSASLGTATWDLLTNSPGTRSTLKGVIQG